MWPPALLDFDFVQEGTNVLLNLGIKNTTGENGQIAGTSGATQSTLVGIGFDLPSIISSYAYNAGTSSFTKLYGDSTFNNTVLGDATLNPFGSFDIGIRSAGSGNFTGGNPQSGLTAGQSTNVSFLLSGSNLSASKVESGFLDGFKQGLLRAVGRFQQVGGTNYNGATSDKVLAGGATDIGGQEKAVPEPQETLPEVVLLAGAVALLRRRQGQKVSKSQ